MCTKNDIFKRHNNWNTLSVFQLISLACFLVTLQIWQIHGFGRVSIAVFLVGIFFSALYSILIIKHPHENYFFYNYATDILLKIFVFFIFFRSFSKITQELKSTLEKCSFYVLFFSLSFIIIVNIISMVICIRNDRLKSNRKIKINVKNQILNIFFPICILSIALQFLNSWPRWDSAAYYLSLENLDILNILRSAADGLIVCGHPTSAYALLVFLFRSIPGVSNLNALYLSSLFLIILDYYLIYFIFKKIFTLRSDFIYSILAFIFICSPYILGNIANINPEHLCLTGLLMFILGSLIKNHYLCTIACYIVCNSRETGVPIIAFLIFLQFVYELYETKTEKRPLHTIGWFYYATVLEIGVIWLFLFIKGNWSVNMSLQQEHYYADGTRIFGFHISPLYIMNQLKGIFLTNFSWIYAFIILIAGIIFIKRNRKSTLKKLFKNCPCIMLLFGMLISIVTICLFLTHHNYRYYTLSILFIQALGLWSFTYIVTNIKNKFIKEIPIILVGILMFIQCHITIDPIMLSIFPTLQTGNAKIAVMPWNIDGLPEIQFLECARYNFQISYFDQALDILFSKIDDKDNSNVLIYDGYQWGTEGNTLNSIWGYGYEFWQPPLWGTWNDEEQCRELSYNPDYIIGLTPIKDYSKLKHYLKKGNTLYYLELPWGDELISTLKEKYPVMELVETVEYRGWKLNLYSFS